MVHTRDTLIEQYRLMHQNGVYGNTSIDHKDVIQGWIDTLGIKSVLDYGCGQSTLLAELNVSEKSWYDPAIPEFSHPPQGTFDLVICTDVLEHLHPDDLDNVLREIAHLTDTAFFTVSCRPAKKTLPDGTNPHTIVRPPLWWVKKIGEYLSWVEVLESRKTFLMCMAEVE